MTLADHALITLRRPDDARIRAFYEHQRRLNWSYPEVGAILTVPPSGYHVDHHRIILGQGEACFERARDALRRWWMYPSSWVEVFEPGGRPVAEGDVFVVRARHFGMWSLSACRVLAHIEDEGSVVRAGIAFGTLPGHVERGEEMFTVDWARAGDGSVAFEVLAFSRPRHPAVRALAPVGRWRQRRFGREARARMLAVAQGAAGDG